ISNVIGGKVIELFGFTFPGGVFIFPLSYLLNSTITELFGFSIARKAILLGLGSNILLALSIQLAIWLPASPHWSGQAAYVETLGASTQIIIASLLSFCVGELCNALLVS